MLELISPIQMIERRVREMEKEKKGDEQLVKDYGVLVEYYSVRDENLS